MTVAPAAFLKAAMTCWQPSKIVSERLSPIIVSDCATQRSKRAIHEQMAPCHTAFTTNGILKMNNFLLGSDRAGSRLVQVQAVTGRFVYTPHGSSNTEAHRSLKVGFSGQLREPHTCIYMLGNGYRAYSTHLLRFFSPDTLSPFQEGGINAYAYCLGDPVSATDPTGHISAALMNRAMDGLSRVLIGTGAVTATVGAVLLASNKEKEGAITLSAGIAAGIIGAIIFHKHLVMRRKIDQLLDWRPGRIKITLPSAFRRRNIRPVGEQHIVEVQRRMSQDSAVAEVRGYYGRGRRRLPSDFSWITPDDGYSSGDSSAASFAPTLPSRRPSVASAAPPLPPRRPRLPQA